MKRLKYLTFVVSMSISPGCAYLDARSSDLSGKIDSLVNAQQFGRAQHALSKVPETHPDYSQVPSMREQVAKQAAAYEKRVLSEGQNLEQQGQWHQARTAYQQALKYLPESEALKAREQALRKKQNDRVEALEVDLLITQGEWLKQNLVVRDELARIAPSNWFKESERADLHKRSRKLAAELGRRGKIALEQGDLELADQLLSFSLQLHLSPAIEEAKESLVKQQQAIVDKKREAVLQSRKFMRKKLLASLQQAIDSHQISDASLYVSRLKLLGKLNEKEQALVEQLALLVRQQVEVEMAQGVELYGRGQYQQAIAAWQRVLALEPDNTQASEHIERAERILEKLQRLRNDKVEE